MSKPFFSRQHALSRRDLLRWGAAAGGSAAMAGVLAACAPAASRTPITAGALDLSFWTHDDGYVKFFTEALPLVSERSDFDLDLSVTKIGATDIVTKLIAQAVAGTGTPDVVGLEVANFARTLRGVIAPELLVDLSAATAAYRGDLISARVDAFSKDGKLYALDSDTPLAVYYYRADEFDRLGLPAEFDTWEEFARAGAAISERDGVSFGALSVGSDLPQVIQGFQLLLMQRGGQLFDREGRLDIETPEAEEALRFAVDGLRSGFFTTVADYYGPSMQSGLKAGKILGVDMPTWYSSYGIKPNVPEQAGRWRVAALPRFAGGGGRTAVGGGTGFAALREKPNTEAAVQLILAAYLDPAQQVKRYRDLGYLPTLRSVFDDPELAATTDEYFGGQALFEVYRDIIDDVPSLYQSEDQAILTTVLSGYLLQAYNGSLSPSQALTGASEAFRGQTRN